MLKRTTSAAALALTCALAAPALAAPAKVNASGGHATTNMFSLWIDGVQVPQVTGVEFLAGAERPKLASAAASTGAPAPRCSSRASWWA